MEKLNRHPIRKIPGRIRFPGRMVSPMFTIESTAPIPFATPPKAPASRKIRTIRIRVSSPPPLQYNAIFSSNGVFLSLLFNSNATPDAMAIPVISGMLSKLPVPSPVPMYATRNTISGSNPRKLPFFSFFIVPPQVSHDSLSSFTLGSCPVLPSLLKYCFLTEMKPPTTKIQHIQSHVNSFVLLFVVLFVFILAFHVGYCYIIDVDVTFCLIIWDFEGG